MILAGSFFSRTPIGFGTSWFIMTLLAATGVIFAAVYMLHAVLRMFWGKVVHSENESLTDLNRREVVSLLPLIVMVLLALLYEFSIGGGVSLVNTGKVLIFVAAFLCYRR